MRAVIHILPGVAIFIAAISSSSIAQVASQASQFDSFRGDGYYWYKSEPEPAKLKPKEKPKTQVSPIDAQQPLSVEWFRQNMPKLLDMAVDNPTKENVANYMYAQRVVLDKSQKFSEQVKDVVATDPFLDENNRVPFAQFAQNEFIRDANKSKRQILDFVARQAGIWVFVDKPEKCSACAAYVNDVLTSPVGGIQKEHGFSVRVVDVGTEKGRIAAKKLGLKVTPTTVLAIPPNGYYLVSQGLMASDRLHERIIIAAKTNGLLTEEYLAKVNPYDKDVLSKKDLDGFALNGNPTQVMSALRQQIKGEK